MVMRFQRENCREVMRFQRGKLPRGDAFSARKIARIHSFLWITSAKKPPRIPGAIYRVLEVPDRDPDRQAWACHENRAV